MKNLINNKYALVILTLVIGGLIGWFIKPSSEVPVENHEAHAESGSEVWTCSMHPQIRQSEPGDCPICGMDLIPLETDLNELDPDAIRMSPTAMKLASIETTIIGSGSSAKTLRLNGKVKADERLLYTQSSHIPGRIEKLSVNFTGEYIKAGQVIAYLYSPELVTAQQELMEAKKMKDSQPALFNAAKEKLKNWKLTENQINDIINSEKSIEQFPVLSNVSGYVTQKLVNLGDHVMEGQALYQIADLSKVWILFDIYESDMSWIKKGSQITYTLQSLPGESFTGKISYVDPVIDPKTRVASARIEISNTGLRLKPEMFASGVVESNSAKNGESISIPKSAVMWTGKRSVVYVKHETDQGVSFKMREITLGAELGESYLVESGIDQGEEIAVNGTFSIDAAAQLAGKPSMMSMDNKTKQLNLDKASLTPILSEYLNLKDALVGDNLTDAIASAKKMAIELKSNSGLKDEVNKIIKSTDIESARIAFQSISIILIDAASKNHYSKTLYVQFCPMADNNKGASWLSLSDEIRNPYFGASMLYCGEVTGEVK